LLLTRVDIQDTKRQLVARFTAGLRQQIQHTITLFNPLTLSEAHQQALTIESQTKGNFSWYASPSTRPSQQQPSSSTTNDAPPLQTNTAVVPFTDKTQTWPSSLRCFACGEIGHRQSNCPKRNRRGLLLDAIGNDVEVIYDEEVTETIAETEDLVADHGPCLMVRRVCLAPHHTDENPQRHNLFHSKCTIAGKVCKFIIDSGSSENMVAEDVVNKLKLTTKLHPCPYKLAWLDKKTYLMITRRALVSFSIGGKFKDQVQCDVAPMDACHLLLGHPWMFDHRVQPDGYLNTYSLRYDNRSFTLQPSLSEKQSTPSAPVLILQRKPFEQEHREEGRVLIIINSSTASSLPTIPDTFKSILDEFQDVFPHRVTTRPSYSSGHTSPHRSRSRCCSTQPSSLPYEP